ncbi:MAG: FN3 associated domain-containing protein, partial [Bacteroidota bacterium]
GDLVLLTKEGILKGGETGEIILPGKPAESLLLKNIHLPADHDTHMPPEGKKQLTELEKKLLEWWVQTGAPFDKKIAGSNLPADLRTALEEKFQAATSPLAALKLDPVSEGALQNLRKDGVAIFPVATGSPFLLVSLAHREDLSAADFKKLKKVSKNIVQLDLRNSNTDDKLLAEVKNFPHLNRLHLDQTAVTDAGLAHLNNLPFLEYLNLYKTQVTDAGLAQLKGLKNLKSAYFWQTGVSEKGIAVLAASLPQAAFNKGIENDTLFGEVQLLPPTLTASKELFDDTLQVALATNFSKAKIHFTLNGSDPDSTSAIYEKPLILDASAELKAIAKAAGWKTSDAVSRQFFKVKYKPQEITLAQKPDPKYAGEGGKTLGDFKRGTLSFGQGGWIAYQGKHLIATIDLG